MSKILDMAKDFEQNSKQQANAIEKRLSEEFERHEKAISGALKSSEERMSAAIAEHSQNMGWLLLKTWAWKLVSIVLFLSATSGILWYQSTLIVENDRMISEQKTTLKALQKKTYGMSFYVDQNGVFVVAPKGKMFTGWTVNKKNAVLLEDEKD